MPKKLPHDIASRTPAEAKTVLKEALLAAGCAGEVFRAPISDASEGEMVAELRLRILASGLVKDYELPPGRTQSVAGLVDALHRAGVVL